MWLELEDRVEIPAALECLAELVAQEQQVERAVEIWGAAEGIRERSGCKRFPSSLIGLKFFPEQAVEVLGTKEVDRLMEQGRSMPQDQAVSLALKRCS